MTTIAAASSSQRPASDDWKACAVPWNVVVMELGSPEAIKGLLSTGGAFAIMSRATAAKEARAGVLTRVPLSPRLTRHLSVVYPKERFHSRLVNSFVQFAKERLAAQQAAESTRPAA